MLRDCDSKTVPSSGTLTWNSVDGVAFQLFPERLSGGGFPVSGYLDDSPSRRFRLEGPHEERGGKFASVTVTGLHEGDVWRLYVAPSTGDVRRGLSRVDGAGNTLVRTAPGFVLKQVDFTAPTSLPADGAPSATRLYLTPDGEGFTDRDLLGDLDFYATGKVLADPRVWDVRDFMRLRFVYEARGRALGEGTGTPALGFYVEGLVRADARALPIFTYGLGTMNNFAGAEEDPASGALVARLELGNMNNALETMRTRQIDRANYIRVFIQKTAGWAVRPNFMTQTETDLGELTVPAAGFLTVEAY